MKRKSKKQIWSWAREVAINLAIGFVVIAMLIGLAMLKRAHDLAVLEHQMQQPPIGWIPMHTFPSYGIVTVSPAPPTLAAPVKDFNRGLEVPPAPPRRRRHRPLPRHGVKFVCIGGVAVGLDRCAGAGN